MKTKLLTFFLMLVACGSAVAQIRIWEVPEVPADTTIVREWKEGTYIVYSRRGASQRITYHDNASPVVRSAQIPSSVTIYDFRIVGDMVFAGGTVQMPSYNSGLIACFDINDLLSGGGNYHALYFNQIPLSSATECSSPMGYIQITGVKRLSLFHDGEVQSVAYIADDSLVSGWDGCHRMGYGDVAYTGDPVQPLAPGWFNYNKDAVNQFTDITVTDSYVVLASWDCMHQRLELVLHDKVGGYVYAAPLLTDIYYFSDHKVLGNVMATSLDGDRFAVAYHYKSPSSGTGLAVKVFGISAGTPVLQNSLEIPSTGLTSTTCEMRDIRYVRSTNELWILNDMPSPVSGVAGSYLYKVDLANVNAGVYEARFVPSYKFHSMDALMNGIYAVSGTKSGNLDVHVEQGTSSSILCTDGEMPKGQVTNPPMQVYARPVCPMFYGNYLGPYSFVVDEFPAEKPCEIK